MALYDDQMEVAFQGMKVDSGEDRVESFPAGMSIPFGRVVATTLAAPMGAVQLPSAAGSTPGYRGVALHSHGLGKSVGYDQYDCVSVMTRGLAWMDCLPAATPVANSPMQFNAAGQVVSASGTLFPGALVRGPKVTLADGTAIVPVEFHSPQVLA